MDKETRWKRINDHTAASWSIMSRKGSPATAQAIAPSDDQLLQDQASRKSSGHLEGHPLAPLPHPVTLHKKGFPESPQQVHKNASDQGLPTTSPDCIRFEPHDDAPAFVGFDAEPCSREFG